VKEKRQPPPIRRLVVYSLKLHLLEGGAFVVYFDEEIPIPT